MVEIFVDAFGEDEGLKVRTESDPEVLKGLSASAGKPSADSAGIPPVADKHPRGP